MLEVGQVSEAQKRPLPPRPRTPTHIHRLPLHRNIPTLIRFKVVRIFEDQKYCQVIKIKANFLSYGSENSKFRQKDTKSVFLYQKVPQFGTNFNC